MLKVKNGIIGHAIGDAMGVPIEFRDRQDLLKNPVTDMIGYGTYSVPVGTWSDDTSMEIATIDSFIEKGSFKCENIMEKFSNWINQGDYTPYGKVFGVGRTCVQAIKRYEQGFNIDECGLNDFNSNGNGSLMRILPVAYYCYYRELNYREMYKLVKDVSSLTHGHEISVFGCYIYVNYVINLLDTNDKLLAYNKIKDVDYSMFSQETLNVYSRILKGDISELEIDDIKSSGYIVDTLEASLWSLLKTENYKEAVITAINLGNDTDTIGAITGSLAGILHGYDNIPNEWLNKLVKRDYLEKLCNDFETILINS